MRWNAVLVVTARSGAWAHVAAWESSVSTGPSVVSLTCFFRAVEVELQPNEVRELPSSPASREWAH